MVLVLILHIGFLGVLEGKPLPRVREPNWDEWKNNHDPTSEPQVTKAWQVLCDHRPEYEYPSAEERRLAQAIVQESYATLDAHPRSACGAGVALLRAATDDWDRLMIASSLVGWCGEKAKRLELWAMASSESVDELFEPVFKRAYWLAEKRRPEFLPAMFLLLRAREGSIFLPLHSWHIPTHDCMFYIFGRYGRGSIPYLLHALKEDDPYVRRNAAFALGYFMDKRAVPTLLKLLDANDVGSGGAAFALGQLGHADAIPVIARLLKNGDSRTRFWGAYALYELGDTTVLPELADALKIEEDGDTRGEMAVAIEHIRAMDASKVRPAKKLTKKQLHAALLRAVDANGIEGDVEGITASAGSQELAMLEQLRLQSMTVFSDRGNKWFHSWSDVIKAVRRREE